MLRSTGRLITGLITDEATATALLGDRLSRVFP